MFGVLRGEARNAGFGNRGTVGVLLFVGAAVGPRGVAKRAGLIASVSLLAALSASPEVSAQCAVATYNFGNGGSGRNLVPPGSPLIPVINSVNTAFLTNASSFVSSPGAT